MILIFDIDIKPDETHWLAPNEETQMSTVCLNVTSWFFAGDFVQNDNLSAINAEVQVLKGLVHGLSIARFKKFCFILQNKV